MAKKKKPFKVPCGPTAFFDCDDTLVMWSIPVDFPTEELVKCECRGYIEYLAPNKYNIDLLVKMAKRGHSIVIWSGGGADWAEAVVKGLGLEEYVSAIVSKPTYYIDDISNAKEWIGKHGYFDMHGKRIHGDNFSKIGEEVEKENK